MRMTVISETLWITLFEGTFDKKKVKLGLLSNFTKCTPCNVPMLWMTTCKTIRSSLGAGFSQNPVPNYLSILYLFVTINLTTLGSYKYKYNIDPTYNAY